MATPHALSAPLTFAPRLKHYMWGGRRLADLLGRDLPDGVVAESWEVSGHASEPSVVDRGPLSGRDLPGLVAEYGVALVGTRGRDAAERGVFPLLVKLLDATHALSVQVHPDNEYAAAHDLGEPGKTEMWYVLRAEEGACVIHGLRAGTDRAALRRAVSRGTVPDCLNRVPVERGDAILVPAGTVHGILSGIVLVEIQQCSDTTYRVHDWDRPGPDGKPRQLHVERALDVIDFSGTAAAPATPGAAAPAAATVAAPTVPRLVHGGDGVKREVLAECDEFVVERVGLDAGCDFEALRDGETCEVWGVLSGSATLEAGRNGALRLGSVAFALLPAAIGRFRVRADEAVVALRAYLP